jgi:hypothetical protein
VREIIDRLMQASEQGRFLRDRRLVSVAHFLEQRNTPRFCRETQVLWVRVSQDQVTAAVDWFV